MAKTVTIVYNGRPAELDRVGKSICSIFAPDGSYIDTPVFTDGYANAGTVGDKGTYGKSIYATNVWGIGSLNGLLPMKSCTAKFAEFERAIIAAAEAEAAGSANEGVTFTIDGYEEELYWTQIANVLPEFTVTLEDVDEGSGGEG